MPAGAQSVDDATVDELLHPSYWLVSGLEWNDAGGMSEAAMAVAPGMIPRDAVSHDAYQVLGCADLYARKHGQRVIFLSDLTLMFAVAGTSWSQLGVDWEDAVRELRDKPFPAMFLTISERAHLHICNPASRLPDCGKQEAADNERELVRQAITVQLAADWPQYMHSIIETGLISLGGLRRIS